MHVSKFISLEGTEGVGKTTAIQNLCHHLSNHRIDYVCTREPGGSPLAETLRHILLNPNTQINDDTELLLMFAARNDHLYKVIMPALAAGKWVICDRFIDSTVAYQGYGRCAGNPEMLAKIESLQSQFVTQLPDLTLWLDLPVNEGMLRAGKRGQADRFEQQQIDFFKRVYDGFYKQQMSNPQRIKRIDASGTADAVSTRIWKTIRETLELNI